MHRLKLEQMKYNSDLRYTNLPKKLVVVKIFKLVMTVFLISKIQITSINSAFHIIEESIII